MGQFNEISRELGHTFAELERARGKSRRSWLRRAHLLLLLADEMMVFSGSAEEDADGGLPLSEPAVSGRRQSPNGMATADDGDDGVQVKDVVRDDRLKAQMFLHFFAETGVHSTKRGSCQGLQTVLVLRSSSSPGEKSWIRWKITNSARRILSSAAPGIGLLESLPAAVHATPGPSSTLEESQPHASRPRRPPRATAICATLPALFFLFTTSIPVRNSDVSLEGPFPLGDSAGSA